MTGPERKYIIRKQGCYYRPNERGYTTSAIQAGRYTRDEAEKITHPNGKDGPRDGMSVIHEDELLGIDEDWTAYSALLADRRDPAVLAALPEVQAMIAAAYEVAAAALRRVAEDWDCGHNESRLCDCGPYVEQWSLAADEVSHLTPADATAALAARDAAMIARGMRRAAEVAFGVTPYKRVRGEAGYSDLMCARSDGTWQNRKETQAAILARAAEIERDGK